MKRPCMLRFRCALRANHHQGIDTQPVCFLGFLMLRLAMPNTARENEVWGGAAAPNLTIQQSIYRILYEVYLAAALPQVHPWYAKELKVYRTQCMR